MPKKKLTAADYLESRDHLMRIILGEMVQNAANANVHWDAAQRLIGQNPDAALEHLAEAWVALDVPIRVERADAIRVLNRTMQLLDSELPDDDDHSSDPA